MKPSPIAIPKPRTDSASVETADGWSGASRIAAGQTDRNRLLWAIIPAALLHLALLAIQFPAGQAAAAPPEPESPVMLIQQYRVKPPEPPTPVKDPEPPAPRPSSKPVIVPTLDDFEVHEPVIEPLPVPEMELPDNATIVEIPIPPPPPAPVEEPMEPILVSGAVVPPVKVLGPEPLYPPLARKVRQGGTVIVRATIDTQGEVVDLQVLRPQPMGLTEATLKAMRQWRYEPATLHGKPVAVYLTLTANFDVQ